MEMEGVTETMMNMTHGPCRSHVQPCFEVSTLKAFKHFPVFQGRYLQPFLVFRTWVYIVYGEHLNKLDPFSKLTWQWKTSTIYDKSIINC